MSVVFGVMGFLGIVLSVAMVANFGKARNRRDYGRSPPSPLPISLALPAVATMAAPGGPQACPLAAVSPLAGARP